jgi:hypothetical protein
MEVDEAHGRTSGTTAPDLRSAAIEEGVLMPNMGASELLIILIYLALEILFVWLVASLASRKGYSPWVWGILAFFFSLITLIIVLVLPARPQVPPPGESPGG